MVLPRRSDCGEDLGPFEETSALPSRSYLRGALRPLQVHVSAIGARRLSLGQGADPRLGHLRPVDASPLTRPTGSFEEPITKIRASSRYGPGSGLALQHLPPV